MFADGSRQPRYGHRRRNLPQRPGPNRAESERDHSDFIQRELPSTFGKLFSMAVDGKVDAEPLYVAGLTISGQTKHNVVYVVTENDSAYAFDADSGTQLWQVSLSRVKAKSPSDSAQLRTDQSSGLASLELP